jgi:hypothetical protein
MPTSHIEVWSENTQRGCGTMRHCSGAAWMRKGVSKWDGHCGQSVHTHSSTSRIQPKCGIAGRRVILTMACSHCEEKAKGVRNATAYAVNSKSMYK